MFVVRSANSTRLMTASLSVSSRLQGKDKLLKLRPQIHVNDINIKAKQIIKWLEKDLKVTVRFYRPAEAEQKQLESTISSLKKSLKELSELSELQYESQDVSNTGPFIFTSKRKLDN